MDAEVREGVLLFSQIKEGKEKALEAAFGQYYKYIVTIAYRYTTDEHASKDIAQDVFADLWKRRNEIVITHSLKAFLRRATINKSLNFRKKNSRSELYDEMPMSVNSKTEASSDKMAYKELTEVISHVVDSLPEKCQQVFKLSRYENMSHKEIAAELNISTKTIENHITKALSALRKVLKEYGAISLIFLLDYF